MSKPNSGPSIDVLVIGAGVIGLTTATLLADRGHRVEIWAREVTPDTTSDAAGALWGPYLCGPDEAVARWSAQSLDVFRRLADSEPESGCREVNATYLFDHPVPDPPWQRLLPGYQSGPPVGALAAAYRHAQVSHVPMIDVSRYMPYLARSLERQGVSTKRVTVGDLNEALAVATVVVNCTGLGSRAMVGDRALRPVRGQTVRVRGYGGRHALIDEEGVRGLTFIFPRTEDTVLGGTHQQDDWRLDPDPDDTAGILARCRALDPRLGDVEISGVTVGLRPGRPEVRLEAELVSGRLLIHNYGHGGGGYTLSWGCAIEVATIIGRALDSGVV